ncbi:MAG: RNA polymerase sigma factor [Planctomycetes bacterium]|nr:RNA polymerase sigma factor [Planctomycetota bacterium]
MSDLTASQKALDAAARATPGGVDFSAQFKKSHRILWLIAAGMLGDRSLAEDVVQDAAIIALEKLDQFTPGTSFTAWMGQMVRNVAMNTSRREHRRKGIHLGTDSESLQADRSLHAPSADGNQLGPKGELPADQSWFDDRVMQALGEVSEIARACLLLRTIESMEYADISVALSIPEGTAMSHVHRTRRHLRNRLMGLWRNAAPDPRGQA